MADNLVIVESPAKAGTIEKYLGSNYKVVASMGHVRDLPSSKLGVNVDEHFLPQYLVPMKAKKNMKALKEAVKGKKTVYLATDLDREGEAIAWHIQEALDLTSAKGVEVKRITFDEITKPAILNAIANPRVIDQDLVDAQQARRVLDRLVGYTLSPVLWRKIYKGLSAGRVQSAALRIVVDREREREAFNSVEYWSLKAVLAGGGESFEASLSKWKGKKLEQLDIGSETHIGEIVASLANATYAVDSLEVKQAKRRPSAPYTTSTLQQDAVNKLGLSSKNAMRVAQKLYEAGHITYMRTDSVDLASVAVESILEHVSRAYGPEYVPATPNKYASKKQAQEAHEAIRPTDISKKGSDVTSDAQGQKLYDMIRRRTLASQMADAKVEQTAVEVAAGEGIFRATGQRILFPGFLAALHEDGKEDNILPALEKGMLLELKELNPEQHFTEPPPRYSEATLIKTLEELGIGRPSTYATTISTLSDRGYVTVDQRRLAPEEIGKIVTDMLKENFPDVVDLHFTAGMEEKLDRVATGEETYEGLLDGFWAPFEKNVKERSDAIPKLDMTKESDVPCPTCGTLMVEKVGRFGRFLACPKYPECKTTLPLIMTKPTGMSCPICGKDIIEKKAKRGMFFGCSGYPTCTFAIWKKEQFPVKIAELEKEGVELPFKDASLDAYSAILNVSQAS
jgi:DNA topoisomerase I